MSHVDHSYHEEIIRHCMCPLPDPYFATIDFVTRFFAQCDAMCKLLQQGRSHQ